MPSSGFGKAFDQDFVLGFQEEKAQTEPFPGESRHFFRQFLNASAGAGVNSDGGFGITFRFQKVAQVAQHNHWHVVYTVIIPVFHHPQGDRFSGAGQAADKDDFHGEQNGCRRVHHIEALPC